MSEVSLLIGNSLERSLDVEESQYVDQALRDLFVTIDSASDGFAVLHEVMHMVVKCCPSTNLQSFPLQKTWVIAT